MGQPWRLLRSQVILSNQWLTFEKNDYQPCGRAAVHDYFIVRRRPFVLVVAESDSGVVFVRQYRPATERFYWSVPAGYIDPGEDILTAAARELLEETGAVGRGFRHIGSLDPLPGYISSAAHVVRCTVPDSTVLRPNDTEVEEAVSMSWADIGERLAAGEITEMQTVSALLLARLEQFTTERSH